MARARSLADDGLTPVQVAAQCRWLAVNAPHLVALVCASARVRPSAGGSERNAKPYCQRREEKIILALREYRESRR